MSTTTTMKTRPSEAWQWRRIFLLMVVLGPAYTLASEWLNTTLARWTYSELMPTVSLAGIRIGVSPLLQWLVLPPLALHLARRGYSRPTRHMQ